ncbi:DUF6069 family protein [Rhodococcus yananensis]|uniref:DUF6069 family protein n=1 Tax=Rhodococcus yananensis TaxID=2879464 RepID=UPI001CF89ABE|nr:DUF6069 family protein [Rhodococcus yananensis]
MTANIPGRSSRYTVDAKRLWAGGGATALVASLTAAVGFLIVRDVLDIPVLTSVVEFGRSQLTTVIGYGVVSAVLATALLHLLILTTPRALSFFGWICILATVAAALWPFTVEATLASKIASGLLYFITGIAIYSLLAGVASAARRAVPPSR